MPYARFSRNKKSKDGYLQKCKPCAVPNAHQKFRTHIKYHYRLTAEDWWEMLIEQSGRCLVCNTPMDDPVVDHCHSSEKIRGLLCRLCNIAAGAVRDDPETALSLAEYLRGNNE